MDREDFTTVEVTAIVFSFIMSVLFGLFTLSMLVSTVNLIYNNTSAIDRKQRNLDVLASLKLKIPPVYETKPTMYQRLAQVMGKPGCLHLLWLIPISFQDEIIIEDELNYNYIWEMIFLLNKLIKMILPDYSHVEDCYSNRPKNKQLYIPLNWKGAT